MPALNYFDYAVIRIVPLVERGEFINAGLIFFCRTRHFLQARTELNMERISALWPFTDAALIKEHLDVIPLICAGGMEAGPIGLLSQQERFHWLVAPRSTVIQLSPPHSGLCREPALMLDYLFHSLVKVG